MRTASKQFTTHIYQEIKKTRKKVWLDKDQLASVIGKEESGEGKELLTADLKNTTSFVKNDGGEGMAAKGIGTLVFIDNGTADKKQQDTMSLCICHCSATLHTAHKGPIQILTRSAMRQQ